MALSGGPDSTALLHLLRLLASEREWRLSAAHLDHGLRPESAAEAERVAAAAEAAGVPCRVGRAPEGTEPTQAGLRRARYDFLRAEAARAEASRIATGHQADDQAETVLFRIARGTGLRGLGGIPRRRGPIVRPLLSFERAEIEAWLAARGIDWLRDPSNEDPRWTRVRIRHQALPALEEAVGAPVAPRLRALARAARLADRALERTARRALAEARLDAPDGPGMTETEEGRAASSEAVRTPPPDDPPRLRIARPRLLAYDREIQARAIRAAARRYGVFLSRGGTRAAVEFITRGQSGGAVQLAEALWLGREFDTLWVGPAPKAAPDRSLTIAGPGPGEARAAIGGREVAVRWWPSAARQADAPAGERGRPRWRVELAARALAFPLTVRGPRPGDRLRLPGGTRKLKKLFGERRIARSARPRVAVVEDAEGRLVWAAGLGTAEDAVPSPSEETLIVCIEEAGPSPGASRRAPR